MTCERIKAFEKSAPLGPPLLVLDPYSKLSSCNGVCVGCWNVEVGQRCNSIGNEWVTHVLVLNNFQKEEFERINYLLI